MSPTVVAAKPSVACGVGGSDHSGAAVMALSRSDWLRVGLMEREFGDPGDLGERGECGERADWEGVCAAAMRSAVGEPAMNDALSVTTRRAWTSREAAIQLVDANSNSPQEHERCARLVLYYST